MKAVTQLGLQDNPLITGLWQVADLERGGKTLDRQSAATQLEAYVNGGFTCFDMADHYGSAELIAATARQNLLQQNHSAYPALKLYTKWCPQPHQHSFADVHRGISERLERLGMDSLDLLQLHWWSFEHPGYIDVMDHLMTLKQQGLIKHIGLTNFDTDHLAVLLSCGHEILTNQVCLSVLDRRGLSDMSDLCRAHDIGLLAYGTLAGGFLSERWLDKPEPDQISDWSKMKYHRFIKTVGGWQSFQELMRTLSGIAVKHGVSVSNVASRWVLQQESVAGVIIGARLTEQEHRNSNREILTLTLDDDDMSLISAQAETLGEIPGDCGSEYRRPPFLTASGDLSDHLDALPPVFKKEAINENQTRWRISSASEFEPICGYSRAVRIGNRILVSGTTATHGTERVIGEQDIRAQTVYILDKIIAAVTSLGGSQEDIVRTRIYLTHHPDWEVVSRVHGRFFGSLRPANTLIEVSHLIGPYAVEIEAEAILE